MSWAAFFHEQRGKKQNKMKKKCLYSIHNIWMDVFVRNKWGKLTLSAHMSHKFSPLMVEVHKQQNNMVYTRKNILFPPFLIALKLESQKRILTSKNALVVPDPATLNAEQTKYPASSFFTDFISSVPSNVTWWRS